MEIPDEVRPTLMAVVSSFLAAGGEPFDALSCPELKALWEAIRDEPTKAWVSRHCKFAATDER